MTLLEIMIVIFLIGTIASVIGYNMKGSLDKGKAFKTEQAQKQIRDILLLEIANGRTLSEVLKKPKHFLENSGLVRDSESLLKDGWGFKMKIEPSGEEDLTVTSEGLIRYNRKDVTKKDTDHSDSDLKKDESSSS